MAQSFLFAVWLGVSPPPVSSKFSLCRWRQAPPCPKARICPLPGGAGLFLGQRPRNYPLPVARGFPRYRWLGVSPPPVTVPVVGEFLRPSPGTAQEVSGSNFKIL